MQNLIESVRVFKRFVDTGIKNYDENQEDLDRTYSAQGFLETRYR
jgi:hypothetical protein